MRIELESLLSFLILPNKGGLCCVGVSVIDSLTVDNGGELEQKVTKHFLGEVTPFEVHCSEIGGTILRTSNYLESSNVVLESIPT